MNDAETTVKKELELYEEKQSALAQLTEQLEQNPQFKQFLQARQEFQDLEKRVWKDVEAVMMDNDITQIKTDTMTLSIASRNNFKVDITKLPKKYIKETADLTKINGIYKLEGTLPKGVKVERTRYLTKRLKGQA
jgi:hypothetical protein